MDIPVKVVGGKLVCCKENHNEPIIMVAADQSIQKSEILLCLKCFQTKKQVSKYISLEEAQGFINEKLNKLTDQQEEQQKGILKGLNEFLNRMMNIKQRVVNQIDEILRISQL